MLGDCGDLTELELRALARELVGRIAQRRGGPYGCRSSGDVLLELSGDQLELELER